MKASRESPGRFSAKPSTGNDTCKGAVSPATASSAAKRERRDGLHLTAVGTEDCNREEEREEEGIDDAPREQEEARSFRREEEGGRVLAFEAVLLLCTVERSDFLSRVVSLFRAFSAFFPFLVFLSSSSSPVLLRSCEEESKAEEAKIGGEVAANKVDFRFTASHIVCALFPLYVLFAYTNTRLPLAVYHRCSYSVPSALTGTVSDAVFFVFVFPSPREGAVTSVRRTLRVGFNSVGTTGSPETVVEESVSMALLVRRTAALRERVGELLSSTRVVRRRTVCVLPNRDDGEEKVEASDRSCS